MNVSMRRLSESKYHGDERSQHLLTESLQIFSEIIVVVIMLDRALIFFTVNAAVRLICVLIIDGIVIVPVFLSKVFIGQLTHSPHIETENRIGDVAVRDVTVTSVSLKRAKVQSVGVERLSRLTQYCPQELRTMNDFDCSL